MSNGSGCKTCTVNELCCDAQYRGSRCAAIRAEHGIDHDPFTNADHIRSMSDEELAKFVDNIASSVMKGNYCGCLGKIGDEKCGCWDPEATGGCVACTLEWLQQEFTDREE